MSLFVTHPLTRDQVEGVFRNAQSPDLRMRKLDIPNTYDQRYDCVPNLSEYELDPLTGVLLTFSTHEWSTPVFEETFRLFWEIREILSYTNVGHVGGSVQFGELQDETVAQSNLPGLLSFGEDRMSICLSLHAGGTDPACRERVFNTFFDAAIPGERIEAITVDGMVEVRLLPGSRLMLPKDYFVLSSYDPAECNLVLLDAAKYARKDPMIIHLYCIKTEDVEDSVRRLISAFGSESIWKWEFEVVCSREEFPGCRDILNASQFRPWNVHFSAKSKYNIDSLEEATREFDSFYIRAFEMKPPRIGEVSVDIGYQNNAFRLYFQWECKHEKQYERFQKSITTLAGDQDIIDIDRSSL